MSRALMTASLYSAVGSRDNKALDKVFITDRSSSWRDNQKGFKFSDLNFKRHIFILVKMKKIYSFKMHLSVPVFPTQLITLIWQFA